MKDDDENHSGGSEEEDELLKILIKKLRTATTVQEMEVITTLILKVKIAQQELNIARLRLQEHQNAISDRRTLLKKRIASLISVGLAVAGPFVLIYIDNYFGTFLMSIGFTSLVLNNGGILKSFVAKTNKK